MFSSHLIVYFVETCKLFCTFCVKFLVWHTFFCNLLFNKNCNITKYCKDSMLVQTKNWEFFFNRLKKFPRMFYFVLLPLLSIYVCTFFQSVICPSILLFQLLFFYLLILSFFFSHSILCSLVDTQTFSLSSNLITIPFPLPTHILFFIFSSKSPRSSPHGIF